jgi:hypothetical protein
VRGLLAEAPRRREPGLTWASWRRSRRSASSSAPAAPGSRPSGQGCRPTAVAAFRDRAARRSPPWPASASSTTRAWNAETSPAPPKACSKRSPGHSSSTTPNAPTCSTSPAQRTRRPSARVAAHRRRCGRACKGLGSAPYRTGSRFFADWGTDGGNVAKSVATNCSPTKPTTTKALRLQGFRHAPKRTRTSTRLSRTRPSTWRVYQFRHRREGSRSIAAEHGPTPVTPRTAAPVRRAARGRIRAADQGRWRAPERSSR